MKNRKLIATGLFLLFTTITFQQKIVITKFNIKEIEIKNNILLKEKDIKILLTSIYGKNLIFLKNSDIEKSLMNNSLIESFHIKKKYPNTLKINVFEKKPIAILFDKKKKFYLSEKSDLIDYDKIPNNFNLPYVFGKKENFKIFYDILKKNDFPVSQIKRYTSYESNRWDIETINNKIIKLPSKNYIKSLENYLDIKDKKDFKRYKIFDYRLENQLILK